MENKPSMRVAWAAVAVLVLLIVVIALSGCSESNDSQPVEEEPAVSELDRQQEERAPEPEPEPVEDKPEKFDAGAGDETNDLLFEMSLEDSLYSGFCDDYELLGHELTLETFRSGIEEGGGLVWEDHWDDIFLKVVSEECNL